MYVNGWITNKPCRNSKIQCHFAIHVSMFWRCNQQKYGNIHGDQPMAGPAKLYSFHKKCLAKPGDFFVKSGIFGETPFTSLVNYVHAFANKGVRFHWLKRKLERKNHGFSTIKYGEIL